MGGLKQIVKKKRSIFTKKGSKSNVPVGSVHAPVMEPIMEPKRRGFWSKFKSSFGSMASESLFSFGGIGGYFMGGNSGPNPNPVEYGPVEGVGRSRSYKFPFIFFAIIFIICAYLYFVNKYISKSKTKSSDDNNSQKRTRRIRNKTKKKKENDISTCQTQKKY
ncbi:hypothetical protein BLOT_013148 [Blomia tropicalis]|nr:hypothetical protein BLOT_013148 [Blomia tropicalis]